MILIAYCRACRAVSCVKILVIFETTSEAKRLKILFDSRINFAETAELKRSAGFGIDNHATLC